MLFQFASPQFLDNSRSYFGLPLHCLGVQYGLDSGGGAFSKRNMVLGRIDRCLFSRRHGHRTKPSFARKYDNARYKLAPMPPSLVEWGPGEFWSSAVALPLVDEEVVAETFVLPSQACWPALVRATNRLSALPGSSG
jgi:hypothetical protein